MGNRSIKRYIYYRYLNILFYNVDMLGGFFFCLINGFLYIICIEKIGEREREMDYYLKICEI